MTQIDAPFDDVIRQFGEARERALALRDGTTSEMLAAPPAGGAWSALDCVEHLNLTGSAFLPLLQKAIDDLRARQLTARRKPRRDIVGWLLARAMEPPVRMRTRAASSFVPEADNAAAVLPAFADLQAQLIAIANAARTLAIDRAIIRSPFDPRIRYNAWSAMLILAAHQRRHLGQAERAMERARSASQ